ncbi:MAG: MBL fold metallo-hydrolase [Chloroflexi bacterium]|nr:MBL fold metallo-hydrolase [Chloroflexota bacterium]
MAQNSGETAAFYHAAMKNYRCIVPTGNQQTRYGEMPKYVGGLYDLKNDLYAWMVPNGSWGESNAGLIVGDGESLLVDTLWDVKFTRTMLDGMQSLIQNAPLKTVVNTHADGDHFWGNQLLPQAEIITSKASYEEMLSTQPKSMLLLNKVGKLLSALRLFGANKVGHWFQGMGAPYDFQDVIHTPAARTFSGTMTLQVGGREAQLIEVGPAHTLGDLMVYVPDARTLFSADILFLGSTPVMWAGPLSNWLAALDKINQLDVDVIVPGHGPIMDKTAVQLVRDYWDFVAEEGEQRFKAGLSAEAAAHDIVLSDRFGKRPFAKWDSPERMMTNMHTLYRHLQGRSDHPKVPELLNIMRKQALLAHALPDAQPAAMRLPTS